MKGKTTIKYFKIQTLERLIMKSRYYLLLSFIVADIKQSCKCSLKVISGDISEKCIAR